MNEIYESDKILAEYLLFHYGMEDEILPASRAWPQGMREALDFTRRTVAYFSENLTARALDLGCAVGGSSFEMSRTCRSVLGVDFSHSFVNAAETLRRGTCISYVRREEAAIVTQLQARLPAGIDATKLTFQQGDAMNLSVELGSFDQVHAANLVCRLSEPERFLTRLPSLLTPGGELVLATPCTWLEEFTPPLNWPLGETLEWLQEQLAPYFTLLRQGNEPFLIRETARKFQWTTSLVTVWRRHG